MPDNTTQHQRPKITALILSHNVEDLIYDCLESVKWADEILVVDSFSTDHTAEIARKYQNTRVLQHEYGNYATQNNWAIPQATHEWILLVDSDEQATDELRDSVLKTLGEGPQHNSYMARRTNYFMGHPMRYCMKGDKCRRLFRRDLARFPDQEVHANVAVEGSSAWLTGSLLHFSFRSFDQYMPKFDTFARRAANDRVGRVNKVGFGELILRPLGRFIKQYFLRRGFLDGRAGLVFCGLSAFSSFLKYARLWEIQEQKKKTDSVK